MSGRAALYATPHVDGSIGFDKTINQIIYRKPLKIKQDLISRGNQATGLQTSSNCGPPGVTGFARSRLRLPDRGWQAECDRTASTWKLSVPDLGPAGFYGKLVSQNDQPIPMTVTVVREVR
jgi:hypothetical protein